MAKIVKFKRHSANIESIESKRTSVEVFPWNRMQHYKPQTQTQTQKCEEKKCLPKGYIVFLSVRSLSFAFTRRQCVPVHSIRYVVNAIFLCVCCCWLALLFIFNLRIRFVFWYVSFRTNAMWKSVCIALTKRAHTQCTTYTMYLCVCMSVHVWVCMCDVHYKQN